MDAGHLITAGVTLAVAVAIAVVVDRAFARRGRRLAAVVTRGGDLTPVADTRVRFLRRLVVAAILVFGTLLALRSITSLSGVMASILASGAVLAAVVGFAAQRTLANLVAGVMLAVTQPLRIGDVVSAGEESGTVEDVRLNYTVLRTPENRRVFIPNEKLAAGVLRNDTIVEATVQPLASFWLAPDGDAEAALAALAEVAGAEPEVAEITPDGVRLDVTLETGPARERAAREAALRREGLRRLRAAGLLAPAPRQD